MWQAPLNVEFQQQNHSATGQQAKKKHNEFNALQNENEIYQKKKAKCENHTEKSRW